MALRLHRPFEFSFLFENYNEEDAFESDPFYFGTPPSIPPFHRSGRQQGLFDRLLRDSDELWGRTHAGFPIDDGIKNHQFLTFHPLPPRSWQMRGGKRNAGAGTRRAAAFDIPDRRMKRKKNGESTVERKRKQSRSDNNLSESVWIDGPFDPKKGGTFVHPSDTVQLLMTGTLINDIVVKGYMNLLAHTRRERMMIVSPQFLPGIVAFGWNDVKKWTRATGSAQEEWVTSPLIFVPLFLGESDRGHWMGMIVDRRLGDGTTRILFGDSLNSQANYQRTKELLRGTAFDPQKCDIKWKMLQLPQQAPGSMDCGIFMLHLFVTYALSGEDAVRSRKVVCGVDEETFGKIGRKHILKSIREGKIDFQDLPVASLKMI